MSEKSGERRRKAKLILPASIAALVLNACGPVKDSGDLFVHVVDTTTTTQPDKKEIDKEKISQTEFENKARTLADDIFNVFDEGIGYIEGVGNINDQNPDPVSGTTATFVANQAYGGEPGYRTAKSVTDDEDGGVVSVQLTDNYPNPNQNVTYTITKEDGMFEGRVSIGDFSEEMNREQFDDLSLEYLKDGAPLNE